MFTEEQIERYSRHIILKGFGPSAQAALQRSRVLVIGAGGLGSPVLLYLAAAGVGFIGIADHDTVDISNLQRQVLYSESDLGIMKVDAAFSSLHKKNTGTEFILHKTIVNTGNISGIIEKYDFVIDGTDSMQTKFLINDACILSGKSFSHAGAIEYGGQVMTVVAGKSACLRCATGENFLSASLSCAKSGILGPVTGIAGSIQALEAIKYLTGTGNLLTDSVLFFDCISMRFHKTIVKRDPKCRVCGNVSDIKKLNEDEYLNCR